VQVLKAENIIGYHEIPWDAFDKEGKRIPNGPYYVKFTAKNRNATIERIFKIAKTEGR
jgi:flagellar hook assembly protein FlgD